MNNQAKLKPIAFTLLFFSSLLIYGFNFSVGAYGQIGNTYVDQKEVTPLNYLDICGFNNHASGYFFQGLIHIKKIRFGLEFGKTRFFSTDYSYYEPFSIHYSTDTYKPRKLLAILQYNIKNSFYFQTGIGNFYNKEILDYGSKTGYMVSISNHIKIEGIIEIPIFLRVLYLTSEGNPFVISLGAGILIKMKSLF